MQKDVDLVNDNLQLAYNEFDKASAGRLSINSCNSMWIHVVQAENAIKAENEKLRMIQSEIQKSINQIQSEVK